MYTDRDEAEKMAKLFTTEIPRVTTRPVLYSSPVALFEMAQNVKILPLDEFEPTHRYQSLHYSE